jgi:hypothetical protein
MARLNYSSQAYIAESVGTVQNNLLASTQCVLLCKLVNEVYMHRQNHSLPYTLILSVKFISVLLYPHKMLYCAHRHGGN